MRDSENAAGMSIVICCYNSALRIEKTLHFIKHQRVPKSLNWEVIIVNNASTDNTTAVVKDTWAENNLNHSIPILIVDELKPGLTAARRRGVAEARYGYVLFCDDDNWITDNYIHQAYDLMQCNPQVGVLGGVGFPEFEHAPPGWFQKYHQYYAVGSQGSNDVILDDITDTKRYVYGACSVFRKEAISKLLAIDYGFICGDRTKAALLSGGDNELCYCLILLGYRIAYSPLLTFRHFIPANRLTPTYFYRLNIAFGKSAALLKVYDSKLCAVDPYKLMWWYQIPVAFWLYAKSSVLGIGLGKMSYFDLKIATLNRAGVILSTWKNRRAIKKQLVLIESLVTYKIEEK